MSLLFNGENIKKFRKWLQLLLMGKTIKNLGADTPSRKRTNVRYNLTQLTNVNPNSIWDNKQNTYGKRISIMS